MLIDFPCSIKSLLPAAGLWLGSQPTRIMIHAILFYDRPNDGRYFVGTLSVPFKDSEYAKDETTKRLGITSKKDFPARFGAFVLEKGTHQPPCPPSDKYVPNHFEESNLLDMLVSEDGRKDLAEKLERLREKHTQRKQLYIMRGPPGSGKSRRAADILQKHGGQIFSTDDYWMRNGVYTFNMSRLSEAHRVTRAKTFAAMRSGISPIIIDNCNMTRSEARPYALEGRRLNYDVEIVESNSRWWKEFQHKVVAIPDRQFASDGKTICSLVRMSMYLEEKCAHGVANSVITAMLRKYDPYMVEDLFRSDDGIAQYT